MSTSVPPHEIDYHTKRDPHRSGARLSDVILGGQDGLVNTLGVILGVAAAAGDTRLVLAAGLAATFAESISMGAVAYTSKLADHAYYLSEKEREHRHLHMAPNLERQEIRDIFARKGFEGELLERIVDTITSDRDRWVDTMLTEEYQVSPTTRRQAIYASILVFVSALIGSLVPLMPFFFMPIGWGIATSICISAGALFAVGAYKAMVYVGKPVRSGLEMAAIGTISALVGYAIGWMFSV